MSDDPLMRGLERGYIDSSVAASEGFRPQLVTNDPERMEKVITCLKQEMETCDEFMFSVAFVNSGGVNALAQVFRELDSRGVKGRIVASQYQSFTEPTALRALLKNRNIEVRIVTEDVSRMHSKCYIFRHGNIYDVLIGSSNLTNSALCENIEWNLKISSKDSGEIIGDVLREFERVFSLATIVDEGWIAEYSRIYDDRRSFARSLSERKAEIPDGVGRPQPNRMQKEALDSLAKLRSEGADRALVISATGSGKTYLSAFDARATRMKLLYIVHRLPVLNKSMESFRKVMEGTETVAKYDPAANNLDADCTFATVQSLSKREVLASIPPDTFEYILIDEVHHAGAESYRRIIDHFKPKFLLGMTATPDRTDGFDIYRLFGYNIAYDIRLKEAMEYRLICPFHYFGISELSFDGNGEEDLSKFLQTELDQRVDRIIENAEYYGWCGDRVKGLAFCRDLKEAEIYSREFNRRGYRTVWVSGKMDKTEVESCIERLEADDGPMVLDYIFAADLFNEGVDIPAINQVLMLRPTESPIVFVQQLGRGLRHHPGKEYVVILDFIGNYEKNYSIPMALTDDHSYSKAESRRAVAAGDSIIPGNSTISFDAIARKRIYESIDRSDYTEAKILREAYANLKMKLGGIPRLIDFQRNGTIDAMNILSKYRSYHEFLLRDSDYKCRFDDTARTYLKRITGFTASGKRRDESAALRLLLDGTTDLAADLEAEGIDVENGNILSVLDGSFYADDVILTSVENGKIVCSESFSELLRNPSFADHIEQVAELSEFIWQTSYRNTCGDSGLVLYMRYTYEDVCRLLNWPKNINGQNLGGYFYHDATKTFPVFINYVKDEDTAESQRYEDRFVGRGTLIALSKSTEGPGSKRMRIIENSGTNGVRIHLFMRKSKNDKGSKEFYYLGPMRFDRFLDSNTPVSIEYSLDFDVRSDLFDYFESDA